VERREKGTRVKIGLGARVEAMEPVNGVGEDGVITAFTPNGAFIEMDDGRTFAAEWDQITAYIEPPDSTEAADSKEQPELEDLLPKGTRVRVGVGARVELTDDHDSVYEGIVTACSRLGARIETDSGKVLGGTWNQICAFTEPPVDDGASNGQTAKACDPDLPESLVPVLTESLLETINNGLPVDTLAELVTIAERRLVDGAKSLLERGLESFSRGDREAEPFASSLEILERAAGDVTLLTDQIDGGADGSARRVDIIERPAAEKKGGGGDE